MNMRQHIEWEWEKKFSFYLMLVVLFVRKIELHFFHFVLCYFFTEKSQIWTKLLIVGRHSKQKISKLKRNSYFHSLGWKERIKCLHHTILSLKIESDIYTHYIHRNDLTLRSMVNLSSLYISSISNDIFCMFSNNKWWRFFYSVNLFSCHKIFIFKSFFFGAKNMKKNSNSM